MDPQHIRSAGHLLYSHSVSSLDVSLNSGALDLQETIRANESQAALRFEHDFRCACESLAADNPPEFSISGFRLTVTGAPQALIEMMVDALPVYARSLQQELDS